MSASGEPATRDLGELLRDLAPLPRPVAVSDLSLDSRTVRPGAAFLACRGRRSHGLEFAPQAVASGARAVLYEPSAELGVPDFGGGICVAAVPELGRHASLLADRFFEAPSSSLAVTGITGTNGKTTCCWLLAEARRALGERGAYLGTLGAGFPPALVPGDLTTPDAVSVQRELAALRAAGALHVAMEVSSHALDQERVTAVRFQSAAFTNLSRDHLDYHGSMSAYGEAKARLFGFASLASVVLNADDAFAAELAPRVASGVTIVRSLRRAAPVDGPYVRAVALKPVARGFAVEIESSFGSGRIELPLLGEFNVDNALTVLALLLAGGVGFGAACRALERCSSPPGRMETFGGGARPLVIVDFAHTPDALAQALAAARAHCTGSLRVVFGCGGERDRGKRPLMGRAAAAAADHLILTDDNPRSEDPAAIVAAIVAGLPPGTSFEVVHARDAAIRCAIAGAGPGDVVVVAGKGHEDTQIQGGLRRAFSDRASVRQALLGSSS
jgi:UDP-N-acetylmuramoyl-L-alanyl-D-glutamate--2,6-diaminopimelate ligase